jgi:hypothetical protein
MFIPLDSFSSSSNDPCSPPVIHIRTSSTAGQEVAAATPITQTMMVLDMLRLIVASRIECLLCFNLCDMTL